MTVWVDAQLSPALALWLPSRFAVEALHVRELKLTGAADRFIFEQARAANAVVLTKDRDFVDLVKTFGAPPGIIWVTCGNTSTPCLKGILEARFSTACELLSAGDPVVEIKS